MSEETKGSFWTIANKPIVIWFLATVVVGLVSFGYDYVQQERAISKTERQIDLEIAARLMHARIFYFPEAYAIDHVRALEDGAAGDESILQVAYGGFRMFRKALDANTDFGAFPEFRDRSLESLIWELLTLRGDARSGELNEALQAAITINRQEIFWMNPVNFSRGSRADGEDAKGAILAELEEFNRSYEKLRLGRWDIGIPDSTLRRYTPDLNVPELGE